MISLGRNSQQGRRVYSGLSQISGVDGSSGMAVNFVASGLEGGHDPECDCREAEAPIQGRLQGPPSALIRYPAETPMPPRAAWVADQNSGSPDIVSVEPSLPRANQGCGAPLQWSAPTGSPTSSSCPSRPLPRRRPYWPLRPCG